ncbi:glycoside hydrolase 43 family protein [Flavobacterium nitrogenifigens]|uniref:Beta-xylosidase n=1 Tax=Flavobacterium nitrogenifigens TaxID=1617283 RepID=A0A521FHD0_9FLAO|nr:glycoside hydrolase 43 family protein [Flavobacterium nitrogenifigens]KAF2339618.1 glycosyl hydrolase 43 family protein [Flavobacterium nitrogenifigens]SMO95555.1 Beta-xylosidase [Flavobacterium nitrogenifigens]
MKTKDFIYAVLVIVLNILTNQAQKGKAQNPIIFADVPDLSIIRVNDAYYMSSTTMHMNPGVPIMKSKDLVNWHLVNYAYQTLEDHDDRLNLDHGKNDYGRGSWASSLRYHNGVYYVSTFSGTTGKTYIYSTKNIEKGPWKRTVLNNSYHDHSLFFDDNGKVYLVWGAGKIQIVELKEDLSEVKEETKKVLIENANAPAKSDIMLPAEGSQLFKVNGKYCLFNICWPKNGMRTVIIHRADTIAGPWEGKIGLQDLGVAQGGLIDTPDGRWFSYLFRDAGGVGRIPYLVPVKWENGWPILGENGKVPQNLNLPANKSLIPGIVNSDEFNRKKGENDLPLVWQWNHNPDNANWSVKERKGYLRLKASRIDSSFTQIKNILTQRTFGPVCSGTAMLELSNMKEGDFAGLSLLQKDFGLVGVKVDQGAKRIVMIDAEKGNPKEVESVPLNQDKIYFKAECDFRSQADQGRFYYSLDGKKWISIGKSIKMPYTIPHFMGYRFGLFNYAAKTAGGFADFDYFRIDGKISETK